MDWILYIFRKGKHIYLVADESLDDAWINLAKRQSCSVDNCKKFYNYNGYMNGNSRIKKI